MVLSQHGRSRRKPQLSSHRTDGGAKLPAVVARDEFVRSEPRKVLIKRLGTSLLRTVFTVQASKI
jgi:hypothetical protein